ncbi:hypothetical protein DICPUDRAFT_49853 [Dictyostelium purpureum]|uniref:Phospholipid-transporting ATPase n=1 Tax=Dictyostelium purpureum TaxID=5786 RepID=F0ZVN9_DICPU|nr:uncharacterized protein DICPUDRAFT_49853 [Dictyostelium purpureum]EGC31992.1 hypothetical protein DICPUDRAFT_49853 [Dictyostelium purpureum]|eukprot:XP_003291490.1 hypothetical protein DICPUDRAFT_49853 [Dictyostelium purpureum]
MMNSSSTNSFRPYNGNVEIPLQDLQNGANSNSNLNGAYMNSMDNDDDYEGGFVQKVQNFILRIRDDFIGNCRTIHINNHEYNLLYKYTNNYVKTSKYSLVTFVPLNLFEQFCRLANFYFLIVSCLQLIPGVSPTGRFTTLGPLCIVLTVTALKEAYEDYKRHKEDDRVNYSTTEVLRNSSFVHVLWKDIQVGDIIKVYDKQFMPADILLLSTSEPDSTCFVETANLDGETNLKMKQSLEETQFLADDLNQLSSFNGLIECEHPNKRLYSFSGSLLMEQKVLPISIKQVLLRGTMLRNTKWINGLVLYSGRDTKLMRNSNTTPLKRSQIEKSTNHYIIFIFFLQMLLCTACAIANGSWTASNRKAFYLSFTRSNAVEGGMSFLTFLILFNNVIPISLYVTMEIVKLIQAYLINNDAEMYHKETDTPALARTSNLNEELGQIEYLFTDKTGTLTQNKMIFKKCSIGGIVYGNETNNNRSSSNQSTPATPNVLNNLDDINNNNTNSSISSKLHKSNNSVNLQPVDFHDDKLLSDLNSKTDQSHNIQEFLNIMAVCHTVVPEQEDGKINYQASSPDENALVNAAKFFGFEFTHRNQKNVFLKLNGLEDIRFEVLQVLEFNSERKRMSVIVRSPNGKLLLYCKGADSVIFERLAPNQPYADVTINHLQDFASEGLRTLCIAYCELDQQVYQEWLKEYQIASTAIINREAEIDRVAEIIETNLFLLGATAIEDKLQKGVPEAINILREAGIKLWVLTGDKQETAINIGYSCQLLTPEMELVIINEQSKENTIVELNRRLNDLSTRSNSTENKEQMALIVDGNTLNHALEGHIKYSLLKLAKNCSAVVCCRVSPSQKAQLVRLVKDNLASVTLAVGDGANDVSMIQAAHVGIGISGEEGLQACRSSDYSIGQFRFLVRLLLVHGRYSYRRISKLVCYCFYKNIALYITQFWFTIFNGWSGQTLYERYTLTAYNVVWTFFPIIIMGIMEKDVSESILIEHPKLYQLGPKKILFSFPVFWGWVLNGIYHSFVFFAIPAAASYKSNAYSGGENSELFAFGLICFAAIIITVNLKLALEVRYWTWVNHLATWGSMVVFFCWILIYGRVNAKGIDSDLFDVIYRIGESAHFYFLLLLVPIIALWRDFGWKFVNRYYKPMPHHIAQELLKSNDSKYVSKRTFSSYAFDTQELGQSD